MKKVDKLWEGKIKPGFEMLVNNFSAGILAAALAVVGFFMFGPPIEAISTALGNGVDWLIDNSLLPLASLIIEPAKVLFLNNAINHGVLTPLGIQQAAEEGKSILFLLEANPGPGVGLLIAYSIFGTGVAKNTAPAALIIQFFGGIHEIYFPFVLMKPITILATIAGGMVGILTLVIFSAGLRAPAAPGSIIAVYAQTPGNSFVGVSLSVLFAAATSFLVGSVILRASRRRDEEGDLAAATAQMEGMKGKKSSVSGMLNQVEAEEAQARTARVEPDPQDRLRLRRRHGIERDGRLGAAQQAQEGRVRGRHGGQCGHRQPGRQLRPGRDPPGPDPAGQGQDPERPARLGRQLHDQPQIRRDRRRGEADQRPRGQQRAELSREHGGERCSLPPPTKCRAVSDRQRSSLRMSDVLTLSQIRVPGTARSKDEAIREAGEILVDAGAVTPAYIDSMFEREQSVSTYMGNYLAIPHGTNESKEQIKRSALSVIRYDEPIDWDGNEVRFALGIAGYQGGHLDILGQIAIVFSDTDEVDKLIAAGSAQEIYDLLNAVNEE